jgi:hypothetical protein
MKEDTMARIEIDVSGLSPMRRGRVEKCLERQFRFHVGRVMTLRAYLEGHADWTSKAIYIRNHQTHKSRALCYEETRDIREYCLWRGDLGIDVPKVIYDLVELPERVVDQRF